VLQGYTEPVAAVFGGGVGSESPDLSARNCFAGAEEADGAPTVATRNNRNLKKISALPAR
jgi:hypothetical protein